MKLRKKKMIALATRFGMRGYKRWDEAGDSIAASEEALRVISEAEAKIASAAEKH